MSSSGTTRREFLKHGALIVGFTLAGPAVAVGQPAPGGPRSLAPEDVDAFLTIGEDGAVTLFTGKVDLGTGIRTALRQIAAEELDVRYERIHLVEGDTAFTPDQGPTWGSLSIQVGGMQIRQAAATARRALVEMAAQRLRVPVGGLEVKYGVVRVHGDPTRHVSYRELIGAREFRLKVDKSAPVKSPTQYTVVGRSVARVDIPAKVTGEWTYMHDVRIPGMLHARVVRPPSIGAQLQSVDEASVGGIRGVTRVVRVGNFLAVVADTEWGAIKAAERVKATWSSWAGLPEMSRLYEHVRGTPVAGDEVTVERGDARGALGGTVKRLKATYEFGIQMHGSIGPSCAVADWRDGKLLVWSASQATHWLRRELGAMLTIPIENIRVQYFDGAGCYGRNGHEDAAADAALLARELGRPVRVQWMRHDEHGWEPKGPPTLVELRAGLDAAGNVAAWESELWIPKLTLITDGVPLVAATLAGLGGRPVQNPGNIFQNSVPPYAIPNASVVCHRLETTPFRASWIRTPGRLQNTYANEAFMDELAAAAAADPVEFRLRHMKDPRGAEVLRAAATRARWETAPVAPQGDHRIGGQGPWRHLHQVRECAHVRGRRGRGRGGSRHRRHSGLPRGGGARLRADDQSRRRARTDRGQCHSDREPDAEGRGEVGPLPGHQRRLVRLSHPHVP